jgi:Flp pilus assembly protein protease CpaA
MIFFTLMVVVVLLVLTVSSINDIRYREVPDLLSWGLVIVALALRALFSFAYGWELIVSGLIGFVICFAISLILYYTGQWGGADSKLLSGMGAVIGVDFLFSKLVGLNFIYSSIGEMGFELLAFIILLLFSGAIYSLIWSIVLAFSNPDKFINELRLLFYDSQGYFKSALVVFFVSILLGIFQHWIFVSFGLMVILSYALFIGIVAVERSCFVKKRSVMKLVEGDWLLEKVRGDKGDTIFPKTLEKTDLNKLLSWYGNGKIKTVTIKEGIPFVPAFLLAYILLLLHKWWLPIVQSFL